MPSKSLATNFSISVFALLLANSLMPAALVLVSALSSSARAASGESEAASEGPALAAALAARTLGGDPRFRGLAAPAQWALAAGTDQSRIAAANARLAAEAESLATAFAQAPNGSRAKAALAALAKFDPETARDGAAWLFYGSAPAVSALRQAAFFPAARLGASAVQKTMDAISSFELLPKPEDYYYLYSLPLAPSRSRATELRGSPQGYLSPAAAGMRTGEPYAAKKCRYFLGWYCNASQYEVTALPAAPGEPEGSRLMIATLMGLEHNPDSLDFGGDGRSRNMAAGYTSFYLVKRAGDSVMLYFSGIQHSASSPSFQGQLNDGQKAEYRQLLERTRALLGTDPLRL
jgi:hypothetical protein